MFRIGFGSDIHRLAEGRPLILGGISIASEKGAVGHSDADALFHAVTDSILGALALGDIGTHFSDKDERWKGAESMVFLREAFEMMKKAEFEVANLDSTISLETPRLQPYIYPIRESLSRALEVDLNSISVKAKTGEGLDSVGESRAIKVEAVILLSKKATS